MDEIHMGTTKKWASTIIRLWIKNKDLLWVREIKSRWQVSSCDVGKGAFIFRVSGVPRTSGNYKDWGWKIGKEKQHRGSWYHNKAAPPRWWISLPTQLSIMWSGCQFCRDSANRMNLDHTPAPGIPEMHKERVSPTASVAHRQHER